MKEKSIAAVLSFFGGGLGLHHFYLGNSAKGLLYLVFCWTFIPALFSMIEGIIFLTMSENTFNLRFNQDFLEVSNASNDNERYEGLEKIANLRNKGILTEEEFQREKDKLVS